MLNLKISDEYLLNQVINVEETCKSELDSTVNRLKSEDKKGEKLKEEVLKTKFQHPLDKDVLKKLKDLKTDHGKGIDFYTNVIQIRYLWGFLIDKSIKALRFFDEREPYQLIENKVPMSYGIDDLKEYFEKYADFEGLLYGSNKSYRDHVIHVFRCWLLGIVILFYKDSTSNKSFISKIQIEGISTNQVGQNFFEILSMWTITALCHDLGYPLEKSQKIFQQTNKMLGYFIANPKMALDLSFSGVQDNMNEHIIRILSSKMEKRDSDKKKINDMDEHEKAYTGRIQPKYHFKFSKSLESYDHGIIGSIILFKTLIYFLETDFNINEDYFYTKEERKQYYLRRDILRAIASHTCLDIYHLNTTTLSFLLIICDDLQEWGRKKWIDFYKNLKDEEFRVITLEEFSDREVIVKEEIQKLNEENLKSAINIIYDQYERYKKLFRDGQDTNTRKFNFEKKFELRQDGINNYNVNFNIPSDGNANMIINFTKGIKQEKDNEFYKFLTRYYEITHEEDYCLYLGSKK